MNRKEYLISQERETALTLELAERLLRGNFNASNTVIVTVSTDYSSNVGQLLRHALTKDGEICDGFGIDVPYPDETWDFDFINELEALVKLFKYKIENKKILLVEAGVIRGSNYKFMLDYLENKLNLQKEIYTLALFENEHSVFKSDFVGEFYDNDTQDLTFWWEKENNHWINKKNMNKTAVEWLVEQIKKDLNLRLRGFDIDGIGKQAKEMEKQQIMDSHNQGYADGYRDNGNSPIEYYNKIFKNK